ncbi:MAG: TIGR01212 family radical SAM protein [Ruminococcaceae bacterium]|nr:TIGR01212 family radical SAM protein [Oscillospiraceae bacterium]
MNNPFPFSDSNKRYYTFDYYLRRTFGGKCAKITLDGGFTCPNRDGTRGIGGCTFCSGRGSGDFCEKASVPIADQFAVQKEMMRKKWDNARFLAYFQAYTNTYASLPQLKELYEEALRQPDVVGLNIATRADCLTPEIVAYLRELSERTALTIELGLQTIHDQTAKRVNRGHSWQEFLDGYEMLSGLDVCVHIINGLPGESAEMMLDTAKAVAGLHPKFLKIHLLHVLEGTVLASQYLKGEFSELSLADYVRIVCDQLEILPPETVLGRVTGDGPADSLIAPLWSKKKLVVMNEIDKELVRRGSYQGIWYNCTKNKT